MSRAISIIPVSSPPGGAPPRATRAGRRWISGALPLLFVAWIGAGSLLVLLGLRTWAEYALLGTRTLPGWYYTATITVILGAPVAGLILAYLLQQAGWVRRFRVTIAVSALVPLLLGTAWLAAEPGNEPAAPAPAEQVEEPNPYQDCVSISGGTNTCPGG